MAWHDYISERAYNEFFEKPAFLRATEPPREEKESWLTKAYERFRQGAEVAEATREPSPMTRFREVEHEMQPAMPERTARAEFERAAPPASTLQRFREVEQRLQPPAPQEPTSARTEFERIHPGIHEMTQGLWGRAQTDLSLERLAATAPRPDPRDIAWEEHLTKQRAEWEEWQEPGEEPKLAMRPGYTEGPPSPVQEEMAAQAEEVSQELESRLADTRQSILDRLNTGLINQDSADAEWSHASDQALEEMFPPSKPKSRLGFDLSDIKIGQFMGRTLTMEDLFEFEKVLGRKMITPLFPEELYEPIEKIPVIGEKAAEIARGITTPVGLAVSIPLWKITALMVAGELIGWTVGKGIEAGLEKIGLPTTKEVGPLTVGPAGALQTIFAFAAPAIGPAAARGALRGVRAAPAAGRAVRAEAERLFPTVREAMMGEAGGLKPRPKMILTNDIRTPMEINKRLGELSKLPRLTKAQKAERIRLYAEKDLNDLRAKGTVDDQMDSLLDDIAQMEQELELRAVAREVKPAQAPPFGTAERAEWEAARAGKPRGYRPTTRFSSEPKDVLEGRLKVYQEFADSMKIEPVKPGEEYLVGRARFTERGEIIEEPTFATEGELAGVRPVQAELGIGAGKRPIETAGPMFERAAPKPAAQAFREATRRPGAPTREEALGRWRAGYEKPAAAPEAPRAAVQPVGREEGLTRWQAGGMGTVEEIEASIGRGLEGRTLGVRGAGPPRKPPTAGAAGGIPAESAGNRFVAPLREFDDVVAEVVTSENPVVRALAGRTGINPSILRGTPTGKALTAYWRQRVSGELLTEVAVSPAIDVHAQMFTGRMGGVLRIVNGEIKNITVKPGQSRTWQDVFSRPGDYALSTRQRAFVNDYLTVVREVEAMRVAAGLKPRAITSKEGWFYVPRQVKGIRGVELRRPSNPGLQRVYEEAQEGVAAGIRYSESPRATLEIHVRAAYREVASAQLTEALAPLSITPRELVPRTVVARMEAATRKWVAANREVRRLRVPRVEKAGAVTAEEKALRTKLKFQRGAAAENLEAAKAEYYRVKNIYSRAMESARKAEVAPGNLFGQAEETIPIASWRNRFFPREQADALNEALGSFLRPAQRGSPFSRGLEVLGNYIRFLAAVGDFAEPFIQGLPTFVYRPNVWAKSALRHYQAWFDPTVQSRFMRGRIGTFQKMAQHGAPIGDPEFFAALTREGGLPVGRLLEVLPKGAEARRLLQLGGKQSFGRFQASYNTGLGSNRALLYESLQPTWKGTEGELWQFIKNMTGGLDTRALGVGPTQRGFESVWLAFSPRLLRSTGALVTDAGRALAALGRGQAMTAEGQASLKALGGLCSVGAGIYVLIGLGLGKSWEEIGTGLNPTQGKRFLSHEINGDWIGIGGQVRAISQLMAHSISALAPGGEPIESFVTTSQFENPILRFYSSRGAPAFNIVGGLVEAGTGLNVLPFDQVDSLPDLLKHLGTSAMPFAIQGKLEGEQWGTTGAALVGFRTSPETVYEKRNKARDEMAQQMFGKPWDELLQGQQNEVRAAEPTLRELETEATKLGAERGYEYSERTQAYRTKKDEYAAEGERALDSDPTGKAWAGWRKTTGIKLNTTWEMLTERFGIKEEPREPELVEDRLAERFWNLEPDANNDGIVSDSEWATYDAEREAILSEGRAAGVSGDYIKHGYRGQMWPNHPRLQAIEEQYQRAKEVLHEYLSIPTKIGMSAEEQEELRPYVGQAQDIARMRGLPFESAVLLLEIPEKLKVRVMLYRELPDSTARESWRYANPEEAQLYDTFYGDVPLGMAQGVGAGAGGQSPFWQTVGGSPGTEPQPVAEGQPSSFWQTVAGGP